MSLLPLETNLFDTIAGLPLHPLVVHAAVVLLPLSAVALILLVLVPRWRERFGVLTLLGLVIGTGAAFVAKESGEALAQRIGQPSTHAFFGDLLVPFSGVLLVVAGVWFFAQRAAAKKGAAAGPSLTVSATGLLAVVLALAVTTLTVLVGHSGAQAVWQGKLGATQSAAAATGSAVSTTAKAGTSPAAESGYTMAQVQQHASASSCWTVVSGSVYDVTAWIPQHPGGESVIKGMCGVDATDLFAGQHGRQSRPNSTLKTFKLGALAG